MSRTDIAGMLLKSKTEAEVTAPLLRPATKQMNRDVKDNNVKTLEGEVYEMKIIWRSVATFAILHVLAFYGLYLYFTTAKFATTIYCWIVIFFGALGLTAGAHRLWSHRSYKARLPMRILLMLLQSSTHQNTIYWWARDHRAHHKFVDTDADPHNAKRGFFFSHIGWLMVKKHPDIRKRTAGIDLSDIASDPVVVFQRKYFYIIMPIMCFIIPTLIPIFIWDESFKVAFFTTMTRYVASLHFTFLANSAAHMWGNRPYNQFISPTENLVVTVLTYGEGWHNYHHVFPWDYRSAELGNFRVNCTTLFIDIFAKLGLAYDLKTVPTDLVRRQTDKSGDGSWKSPSNEHSNNCDVWGWNDKDLKQEDIQATQILRKKE